MLVYAKIYQTKHPKYQEMITMKKKTALILIALCIILVFPTLAGCGSVAKAILKNAASNTAETTEADDEENDNEDKEDDEKSSKKKRRKKKRDHAGKKDEDEELTEDIYKEDPDEVFAEMADWAFIFSSGAGGWGTELYVEPDGTFRGRYSDSDMGSTGPGYENGTVYQCDFSGRFSKEVRSAGPRMHSLKIESIEYGKKPNTEEITDNIKYIYTTPYGLEGLDGVTGYDAPLIFLEAGAVTSVLNEEEMSWVSMDRFGCSLGENWDYVQDVPEELPYAVLVNTVDDYAFYSENISEKNKTFMVNKVQLPGLRNMECTINKDGTYYCVDENSDASFRIINTCFKTDKLYDTYLEPEDVVNDSLKKIYGKDAPDPDDVNITSPKNAYEMSYPKVALCGEYSDYAFWYPEKDSYKVCREGRFFVQEGYMSDTSYVYAYIIETDEGDRYPDSAFAGHYITSLTLTGKDEFVSSAGDGDGAVRSMLTNMMMSGDDIVKAKELIMVSESDKDLIKKYHLENASFDDDYEMVSPDNKYHEYKLANGYLTPFYIDYPSDKIHSYRTASELWEMMGEDSVDTSKFMQLYLNENDEVVYAYEMYTP